MVKADASLAQIDYTIPNITYALVITGKQAGVTDIVVDGRIYRVTVTGGGSTTPPAPEHVHAWAAEWSSNSTHH